MKPPAANQTRAAKQLLKNHQTITKGGCHEEVDFIHHPHHWRVYACRQQLCRYQR
jgi:hypothetical protein